MWREFFWEFISLITEITVGKKINGGLENAHDQQNFSPRTGGPSRRGRAILGACG
jgi:hypothetical protein